MRTSLRSAMALAAFSLAALTASAQEAAAPARTTIYQPAPLDGLHPEMRKAVEQAQADRARYLEDASIPHEALEFKLHTARRAASGLMAQGRWKEALAVFGEIDAIHPLRQIPIVDVAHIYFRLLAGSGDREQGRVWFLRWRGLAQAIAHSGDGATEASAIPVLDVSEEYDWLRENGLARKPQELIIRPHALYDLMTAADRAGNERQLWFDVTRLMAAQAARMRK